MNSIYFHNVKVVNESTSDKLKSGSYCNQIVITDSDGKTTTILLFGDKKQNVVVEKCD